MDSRSFGNGSRGGSTHRSSSTEESSSFAESTDSSSSFHELLDDTLITLEGQEGCKIKASKTVICSCNELLGETIEEQKNNETVNLGDYSMRALLGLVEFCQHNELSQALGVKTKSSAIGLSDLYQIAGDYMFHDLTRSTYDACSEMVDADPSLACVFLKRNPPYSSLFRLGLKAVKVSPKAALENADDDLLKKLNRDLLKVVIKSIDWREREPELLPHILVRWICAWGGLAIKVEIARGYTKSVNFPTLDPRICEACKWVGMCITDQDVALEGYNGCRIFTKRSIISAANKHLKEVLDEKAGKKVVSIGNYSMRAVLGLVEFCQYKDISLTLGAKKKTAAITLAELSQIAKDHMFTELEEHVYKTCSSMIKDEPWLAFVMLKRTQPGTPLYRLGTKYFRICPKEILEKADDELLKKLNRDRITLVVDQVDWTQKDHDLLPHVLSNWITAWDGLPIKIEIARGLLKSAKIDISCLPTLVLDAAKMTGLIDSSMIKGSDTGDRQYITLLGRQDCRVQVVKAVMASRNFQLKELVYSGGPNAQSVVIGDYSKRAIVALAEYCHNDHFCQTLGAKDANSAHGLVELAKISSDYMFHDLGKDVYQASVRLMDAEPSLALIFFRRCVPNSALSKLALRTFRFRLKESLLMANPKLQKLLDNKRLTSLVDLMRWKEEPQMLLKVLVEWVKIWNVAPEQLQHARYIASDINIDELTSDTLMLLQKSGLINPAKIRVVLKAREDAGELPPRPPVVTEASQPDGIVSDGSVASLETLPTATSGSANSADHHSWVGLSVGEEEGSVVSVLEAECDWTADTNRLRSGLRN